MLTLLLAYFKMPETKNKRVGVIKKELHYLKDWNSTVSTMPNFDVPDSGKAEEEEPVEEEIMVKKSAKLYQMKPTELPGVVTPAKLRVKDEDLKFIDNTEEF